MDSGSALTEFNVRVEQAARWQVEVHYDHDLTHKNEVDYESDRMIMKIVK